MKPFYMATTDQMKELDRRAIEERGIPSIELMENAATHVADVVCELMEKHGLAKKIAIFCSQGNNGGDGVAAARLLMERGYEVRCFLSGNRQKMTDDCKRNEERLITVGGVLEDLNEITDDVRQWVAGCSCIVDALFGFGLSRDLTGIFADVVALINERRYGENEVPEALAAVSRQRVWFKPVEESGCVVISCDFPSGVNGNTGQIMGCAVKADVTVTFSCAKPGLFTPPGAMYSRRVKVVDIGIPADLYAEVGIEPAKMLISQEGTPAESDAEFYKK